MILQSFYLKIQNISTNFNFLAVFQTLKVGDRLM